MMKKTILFWILMAVGTLLAAQTAKDVRYVFTEASDLNLIGKIIEGTSNPYHRVDTTVYKGFTKSENTQVRCSAGLAVLFRTNSTTISVKTEYGYMNHGQNTMGISLRGYDLYIRKDGNWLYAESGVSGRNTPEKNTVIIKNMDSSMKECMLYLPIYSEVKSCLIGVEEGAVIESLESPFRYRIGVFGSSFTHGISTSRPGMSYPMQLMRMTGIQMLNLGCSGNCKMQPYFADVLCDADVDAFLFDCFSNPTVEQIEERLIPFVEKIRKAHPDIPLIFQQTIYRESRNFSVVADEREKQKMEAVEKMMKRVCRKFDNVYFIHPCATSPSHETSVDATHPDDYGYTLWAESIKKDVLDILDKKR